MPQIERRHCPKTFQDRLTRAVGTNQYGLPLFKIAWGQSITYTAGGVWTHDHFIGYRPLSLSNSSLNGGSPCWMILEWHPAEDYETDAVYYYRNRDERTGLQDLGEYPYRGRYEVAYKLTSTEFRNGKLQVFHYHLDGFVLNWIIPIIVEGKHMSHEMRLRRLAEMRETDEKEVDRVIDDAFKAGRRRPLPSQIDDRVRLMQKQMSEFLKKHGRIQPGFKINNIAA